MVNEHHASGSTDRLQIVNKKMPAVLSFIKKKNRGYFCNREKKKIFIGKSIGYRLRC
jgi:hypothetical protein